MKPASIAAAVVVVAAAWVVADRMQASASEVAPEESGGIGDSIAGAVETAAAEAVGIWDSYIMPVSLDLSNANLRAFLAMIRHGEGTASAQGYRMLFGGRLVESLADHPRVTVCASLGGQRVCSTAAGAYQFLEGTWDEAAGALGLSDFGPENQDAAAAWLIRRRGALADVMAGRFDAAVRKCAREWASLPGSPYGQPTKTMAEMRRVYVAAGGTISGGAVYA